MFLNFVLNLTVIDLMSIVHMEKIWVEVAKNFEMRTSGGRGGLQWFRTPPDEGGRGVKKGQIFADVLYGWPLIASNLLFLDLLTSKFCLSEKVCLFRGRKLRNFFQEGR